MVLMEENTTNWKTQGSLPPSDHKGDLYLHVGGSLFVVHRHILRKKCPQLYRQIHSLEKSEMNFSTNQRTFYSFQIHLLDEKQLCHLQQANQTNQMETKKKKHLNENGAAVIHSIGRIPLQQMHENTLQDPVNHTGAFELMKQPASDVNTPSKSRLDVEISCMDPQVFGILLDFVYTENKLPHVLNLVKAQELLKVCLWLGLDSSRLAVMCLEQMYLQDLTVDNWFTRLVQVASYSSLFTQRESIIKKLLDFLSTQSPDLLNQLTFCQLVAIQQEKIVLRVVSYFLQMAVQPYQTMWTTKLLNALSLWFACTYRTSSLLALHSQFASWYPLIVLQEDILLEGVHAFIRPTRLFCFGQFEFQVRLQMVETLQIQWRIMKQKKDTKVDDTRDTPFVVRGRLGVRIQLTNTQQQEINRLVNIRYEFDPKKTLEGTWYQLDNVSPSCSSSVNFVPQVYDGIRVRFSGHFFIWATPLINLYHFLLLSVFPNVFSSNVPTLTPPCLADSLWEKDTLCLILASDRLRREEEEILKSVLQWWRVYSLKEGLRFDTHDKILLDILGYIRWGFIRMETIFQFLVSVHTEATTQIQLIQLIQRALTRHQLLIPRRASWGMKYNTNQQITTRQDFDALCIRIRSESS